MKPDDEELLKPLMRWVIQSWAGLGLGEKLPHVRANRRPPAWKPPPHVHKPLKRNIFGRLMQARIGHAHIGEYYRDFNIPEEISCPCGETTQTRIHILSECPLYDEHRHLLHDEDQNIIPTDIFGTRKGIERLIEFLSKTNAFANHNQV
jgi:hypothetical protein